MKPLTKLYFEAAGAWLKLIEQIGLAAIIIFFAWALWSGRLEIDFKWK